MAQSITIGAVPVGKEVDIGATPAASSSDPVINGTPSIPGDFGSTSEVEISHELSGTPSIPVGWGSTSEVEVSHEITGTPAIPEGWGSTSEVEIEHLIDGTPFIPGDYGSTGILDVVVMNFTTTGTLTQTSDRPTNNYAVMTDLWPGGHDYDVSEQGRKVTSTDASQSNMAFSSFGFNSGAFSATFICTAISSGYPHMGIAHQESYTQMNGIAGSREMASTSLGGTVGRKNSTIDESFGGGAPTSLATGLDVKANTDVVRIEVDYDLGTVEFFLNNVSEYKWTGQIFDDYVFFCVGNFNNSIVKCVFEDTDPDWETPSDSKFKALNTYNLARITNFADDAWHLAEYEGSLSAIDYNAAPFVVRGGWWKDLDAAVEWKFATELLGADQVVHFDSNALEGDESTALTAFTSNGFDLGANFTGWSANGNSYMAMLPALAASQAFTAGDYNANALVAPHGGFVIGEYTAGSSPAGGETVEHGLGGDLDMLVVKRMDATGQWYVFHKQIQQSATPENFYQIIDTTQTDASSVTVWNNTAPTGGLFTLGTSAAVNAANGRYMYMGFKNTPGIIHTIPFFGNQTANGAMLYSGFSVLEFWTFANNAIDNNYCYNRATFPHNGVTPNGLKLDLSNAMAANATFDWLANGVKLTNADVDLNRTVDHVAVLFAKQAFGGENVAPAFGG